MQVVCVHGVGQCGRIFRGLAQRLSARGADVVSVDLRGHGGSRREPPWDLDAHVADLEEVAAELGIADAVWIGHSFGARAIAALAGRNAALIGRLVLLDPVLDIDPKYALRRVEIERLDWSFATPDGAVAALSGVGTPSSSRTAIAEYARQDLVRGPDGKLRFNFSPGAVVVAWSEMSREHPPLKGHDVLVVKPADSSYMGDVKPERYEEVFGPNVEIASVPNGHNVLWEAPEETAQATERFLFG